MIKYNFDEIINRKDNHSVKYNELQKFKNCPDDLIPLWIADMDFKTSQSIIEAIKNKAEHGIFGYVYRPEEYFDSFVRWQKRRFDWDVNKEMMSFSVGVVPSLGALVNILSEKGDKILIQTPVYSEFYDINLDNERVVIENKLNINGSRYEIDFIDFENKLKEKPKVFILCNPHNPLGKVWTKEELEQIGELCLKYNVPIISDEIHADLTLWGKKHIPMASISDEIARNTITCTSTGKAFNLAGLQSATIIFNNSDIKRKFDKFWKNLEIHRNNPFNLVATIAAYSDEGEEYLNQLITYLENNILYVNKFLHEYIPIISSNVPEATYLVWIDFRKFMKEFELTQDELEEFLITKAKLGLNSCRVFQHNSSGFMRLNVACPKAILEKAMWNLKKAVDGLLIVKNNKIDN